MSGGMSDISHAGDLIFCRPGDGVSDWIDRQVARLTAGPYSHVRVRLDANHVIEALGNGVVLSPLLVEPDPADVAAIGAPLRAADEGRFTHALSWLAKRLGDGYSGADILADTFGVLLPKALGSRTPFLVTPSRYDCSELATRFTVKAGFRWLPDALEDTPQRVSPNDLARALGVIKG